MLLRIKCSFRDNFSVFNTLYVDVYANCVL